MDTEKPLHLLLVDDDPMMIRLFSAQFTNVGFEVLPAHDGNEGREMARRFQPDLILLDMRMPVMDGIETLARIKDEELTKHIPVILFTNEDLSREAEQRVRELGADDYLHKGTPTQEVIERINKVLAAHGHTIRPAKGEV